MKKIQYSVTIMYMIGLIACSGVNKRNSSDAIANSANTPITDATASFSAVIDGVKVTGNGIDEMQLKNTAFIYPNNKGGNKLLFILYSTKGGDDNDFNYSLICNTPNETGLFTHIQGKDDGPLYIVLNMNIHTGTLGKYTGDSITVHILSLSATRVTGTFSGHFSVSPDTPHADKNQVTVTNGSFDIPFSTGNLKPL